MKKWSRWIALILMMCCLLSGCAWNQKTNTAEEKKTILIWTWDDTFNVKAAKMAAQEYQKKHKDIKIVIETKEREEILTNTKIMFASKVYDNLPDVIMIEDYDIQDVLQSHQNEFVELTNRIDYDKYVDFKKRLCEKDGHFYGIPFDCGTAALFYRIDIIEAAGYKEKDMENLTWSDYIRIGRDVYDKTGTPMLTLDPTDLPLIRLIMQSCGEWYVKEDGITANIEENNALRQALLVYDKLLEENLGISVNGWNEFISAFQKGDVATVLSGSWIMSSIMENSAQNGLWRVTSIPVMEENEQCVSASNVGGSAWYILKNSSGSEAATDFMIEMFTENNDFFDDLVSEIGVVLSLKDSSALSNYNAKSSFFGNQKVTQFLTEKAAMVHTVNYGSKTYEIEAILESELQNALLDGDWEQCLSSAQRKADAVARE